MVDGTELVQARRAATYSGFFHLQHLLLARFGLGLDVPQLVPRGGPLVVQFAGLGVELDTPPVVPSYSHLQQFTLKARTGRYNMIEIERS